MDKRDFPRQSIVLTLEDVIDLFEFSDWLPPKSLKRHPGGPPERVLLGEVLPPYGGPEIFVVGIVP